MGTWKNSMNFESAENVRSSIIVEFECELRHIPSRAYYTVLCSTLYHVRWWKWTVIVHWSDTDDYANAWWQVCRSAVVKRWKQWVLSWTAWIRHSLYDATYNTHSTTASLSMSSGRSLLTLTSVCLLIGCCNSYWSILVSFYIEWYSLTAVILSTSVSICLSLSIYVCLSADFRCCRR